MRRSLPYILLLALFVGYVLLEVLGPQPVSWRPSYERSDDIAFGSMLLYESLPDLFPGQDVTVVEESPTVFFKEFEPRTSNYLIIQEELKSDQFEARALIDYVERGNSVFIAAAMFSGSLADSLDIHNTVTLWEASEKEPAYDNYLTFREIYDEAAGLQGDSAKVYPLLDDVIYNKFTPPIDAEILGQNKQRSAVFLRIARGEGNFYVHAIPLMFTNYFMTDPLNQEYISRALSFLPNQPVYWDEYFKPGHKRSESPVRYVLESPALRWAWFLLIGMIVVFMVFEGKRRQRVIPILETPVNTSLEFTQTVGQLYYAYGDHKDIAEKKFKFLLEYIRNRWNLSTRELSDDFIRRVAVRAGIPQPELSDLFRLAQQIQSTETISEATLVDFSRKIDDFYGRSK